jgi:hypothetical protein
VCAALHSRRTKIWFVAPDHIFNNFVINHQHRLWADYYFATGHIDVNNKSLRATAACDATSLTKRDKFD